jgi:hypothetical protein
MTSVTLDPMMRTHGYYWCDTCDERADGPRCEHQHAARWIHVGLHHARPAVSVGRSVPQPVSPERGRELWARLHEQLKF